VTKSRNNAAGFKRRYLKKDLDEDVFLTTRTLPSPLVLRRFLIKSTIVIKGDLPVFSSIVCGGVVSLGIIASFGLILSKKDVNPPNGLTSGATVG